MGARITAHQIETTSVCQFRRIVEDKNIMFRELSGRDYGIDGIIELYENENPTGKIAFVQIKGTSRNIVPLKSYPNEVACSGVTKTNLMYAKQKKIPVILIFLCCYSKCFYYKCLNEHKANNIKNIIVFV